MFNFISAISSALSKKIIRIILIAVIITASVVCYYNTEELTRNPFSTRLDFYKPIGAVMNQDGYIAVLDSIGTRIVVMSPEKQIISTISYSRFSSSGLGKAVDICISREYIYAVDYIMQKDGMAPSGQRILVYDLNGNFQKVLTDSSQLTDKHNSCEIHAVSTSGDRIYATLCYNESDTLIIADVTDGTPKIIHKFATNGTKCYFSSYNPDTDVTTAVGYNGRIIIWRSSEKADVLDLGNTNMCIERAYVTPEGSIFLLDSNSDAVFVAHGYKKGPENGHVFVRTHAKDFSVSENHLVYAETYSDEIRVKNISDGRENIYKDIPYSTNIILKGFVTWGMLLLGIASAVLLSLKLVFYLLSMLLRKPHNNDIDISAEETKPMTVAQLYAYDFIVLFLIFGITAAALGGYFYSAQLRAKEVLLRDITYGMSRASANTFGPAVSKIHSAADYDTKAYKRIEMFTSSAGMTKVHDDESLNILTRVIRFNENGNCMIVKDDLKFTRIGGILNVKEQSSLGLGNISSRVKAGNIETYKLTSDNGVCFVSICAPIYNSSGKVIGVLVTVVNRTLVQAAVLRELMEKLLQIFTFLVGLVMLLVELKYMREVSKIQKERHRKGIWNTTVVEINRTINIFSKIPTSVYIVFCTLITAEIMNKTGLKNPLLLAAPVTVNSIMSSVSGSGFWPLIMTRPKKGMQIGAVGEIAGMALLFAAYALNNYLLVLISSIMSSMASGLLSASLRSMSLLPTPPQAKYRYMLSTNTEAAIASAIGISTASVVMSAAGVAGLTIYVAVICLGMILIIRYFMGDDLAVKKETDYTNKTEILAQQKKKIAFFLHPQVAILLLITVVPSCYINGVTSYVMPLFNKYAGYSDVYIGAITLIAGLIGLFATPALLRVVREGCQQRHNSLAFIFRNMLFLGVVFVLFGLITTLRSLILVVVGTTVINPVISGVVGDIINREGAAEGFNSNETAFGSFIINNVCNYTQSIVLSLTLAAGFPAFGYIWAIVFVIGAALMLLLIKKQASVD